MLTWSLIHATEALPAWAPNGNPLCTASGDQITPRIVSDGAEGAIVVWLDKRGDAAGDFYAQRVDASGAVAPGWAADGMPVSVGINEVATFSIASDGAGGVIVGWGDLRTENTLPVYAIYAQRITAAGTIAPGWPPDGLRVAPHVSWQLAPVVTSDGAGGAILAWSDSRDGPPWDIYAQRITGGGAVATGWAAAGRSVTRYIEGADQYCIAPDGAHGALVAWRQYRASNYDIFCARLLGNGQVGPGWLPDGSPACIAPGTQSRPSIAPDGKGGAFLAWWDERAGAYEYDIFAQHMNESGAPDSGWTLAGLPVCQAIHAQTTVTPMSDGAGGAYFVWADGRSGLPFTDADVYAARVDAAGQSAPGWATNGMPVCVGARSQLEPTGVSDGAGGLIAVWRDLRSPDDIYAQRLEGSSQVAPGWPYDGVALCLAGGVQSTPAIAATGGGAAIVAWQDARGGGGWDIYAQGVRPTGPYVTAVAPDPGHALLQALPTPFRSVVCIRYHLPSGGPVRLDVFDIAGRRRVALASGEVPAGQHSVAWDGRGSDGRPVPPGMYFVRLVRPGDAREVRIVRLP